jgi:acyl dehydratase
MNTSVSFDAIADGDALPPLVIAVTPSLIVAGAMASGDFEVVHHDKQAAQERGTPDIFMNILTTNGYVQRYVNAWAGNGRIRSIELRLGVPNLAGEVMKLSGRVNRKLEEGGERILEIAVRGANSVGEHVTAMVRLALV